MRIPIIRILINRIPIIRILINRIPIIRIMETHCGWLIAVRLADRKDCDRFGLRLLLQGCLIEFVKYRL